MTADVLAKLAALVAIAALGFCAVRWRWLGEEVGPEGARLVGNLAFNVFIAALLFRTTARLDVSTIPWRTAAAYFGAALLLMLAVYAFGRWRPGTSTSTGSGSEPLPSASAAAEPATRAICATYGNTVQLGIPVAAAVYGEAGLALHIPLISIHALILLTVLTALVELDLARTRADAGASASRLAVVWSTARSMLIHPVLLPVMAGLTWNATGWRLPGVVDDVLQQLGQAAVPLCLVLIGISMAAYGVGGRDGPSGLWRGAWRSTVLKCVALPALVLLVAQHGFGLSGVPLHVAVMMAATPVGSNALIFAQRYEALEAETTLAIVISTLAYVGTAMLWLGVLGWVDPLPR